MPVYEVKSNELLEVIGVTLEQFNIDVNLDTISYYGRLEQLLHLSHKTSNELLRNYLVEVAGFNKDWFGHSTETLKNIDQFLASSRVQDECLELTLKTLRESLPTYDNAFQNLLEIYSPMEIRTSINHEGAVASIRLKRPSKAIGNFKVHGIFEQCGVELDDLEVTNEHQDAVVVFSRADFALRFSLKSLAMGVE